MKEIEFYKMYVVDEVKPITGQDVRDLIDNGFGFTLTGRVPMNDLLKINEYIRESSLNMTDLSKTLFTRKEWQDSTQVERIIKQIVHYVTYGTYGVQKLEVGKKSIDLIVIKVVTKEELKEAIESDIYNSKPLSSDKVNAILELIDKYNFKIKFNKILNREVRAAFVARNSVKLPNISGDDVVRAFIFKATESQGMPSSLLINSREVRNMIKTYVSENSVEARDFLTLYVIELAQVFRRHKDLILSAKHKVTANIINRISKLANKYHVPIKPVIKKNLIGYFNGHDYTTLGELYYAINTLTVTEKFNLLNLLAVKKAELDSKTYFIRNGKIWTKEEKQKFTETDKLIKETILKTLDEDLKHLKGKTIKMPLYVEYGLPVSEKQSVGNVPFGTVIRRKDESKVLTAGMYWRNDWGSRDLDLSSVSLSGARTGWGMYRSYEDRVIFSGDITNAPDGAIECMGNCMNEPVILINNIFDGECGTKFKIVIGEYNKDEIEDNSMYIEDTLFNFDYKFQGNKKSCILGALTKDKFIVYPANLGCLRVSRGHDNSALKQILVNRLSLRDILVNVGATVVTEGECAIDLSLEKITFQDLVNLVENKEMNEEEKKIVKKCVWHKDYYGESCCVVNMPDSVTRCKGYKYCEMYEEEDENTNLY